MQGYEISLNVYTTERVDSEDIFYIATYKISFILGLNTSSDADKQNEVSPIFINRNPR